jgi:hypothetical protein
VGVCTKYTKIGIKWKINLKTGVRNVKIFLKKGKTV